MCDMSLNEETKMNEAQKIKEKIKKQEEHTLKLEWVEYSEEKNTKKVRNQLLRLTHYYHLLELMGEADRSTLDNMNRVWHISKLKISKAKEYDGINQEIASANLVDEHIRAWNMAQYYYEKASKILCQMTITLMDYILQEEAGYSLLYSGKDKSSYFDLLDEIESLNRSYVECGCFLSAYDFCTEKIADFLGIEEYRSLTKEHLRIVENGMTARVTDAINKLKEITGEKRKEYFIDICAAYKPDPPYDEDLLEEQYQRAVSFYGEEAGAMAAFTDLVVRTERLYEHSIEE